MKKLLIIMISMVVWNYTEAQTSYFPVEKGSKWTYAYGKEIYGGTPYEDYKFEVEILENEETIDGKEYFVSKGKMVGGKGDDVVVTSYFRFVNDGSIITRQDKATEEIVQFSNEPKVGDKFGSQQDGSSKVLDLNATITTPTTTHSNCLMVEVAASESTTRVYYQKNIGMVATTMIMDGSEKIFIYLLSK